MTIKLPSAFVPGHVFRTRDLAGLSANPSRLVKRWIAEGACTRLRNGLYAIPKPTEFGLAPPSSEDLLRTFLDGDPFVVTGPPIWNALRLGGTQLFALPLVYNRKRSGTFRLGGRTFRLRRVRFPDDPRPEWFVVDLLENLGSVCLSHDDVEGHLVVRLNEGMFDQGALARMADEYGTKSTQALVHRALHKAFSPQGRQRIE
jgi:hypothetical protein